MRNYLGRIVLLVEDYEKSANFYEKNFGFTRFFDVTTDVGQRFRFFFLNYINFLMHFSIIHRIMEKCYYF